MMLLFLTRSSTVPSGIKAMIVRTGEDFNYRGCADCGLAVPPLPLG